MNYPDTLVESLSKIDKDNGLMVHNITASSGVSLSNYFNLDFVYEFQEIKHPTLLRLGEP